MTEICLADEGSNTSSKQTVKHPTFILFFNLVKRIEAGGEQYSTAGGRWRRWRRGGESQLERRASRQWVSFCGESWAAIGRWPVPPVSSGISWSVKETAASNQRTEKEPAFPKISTERPSLNKSQSGLSLSSLFKGENLTWCMLGRNDAQPFLVLQSIVLHCEVKILSGGGFCSSPLCCRQKTGHMSQKKKPDHVTDA